MLRYRYKMMKWIKETPFEFNGSNKNPVFNIKAEELKKSPDRFRNIITSAQYYLNVIDNDGNTHKDEVLFETWSKAELNTSITAEKSRFFSIFYGIKE